MRIREPMELRVLSPDFDEWPQRWMGMKEDLEYGKKLLPYMEAFLNDLLMRDLSRRTLKNYIDNTWLLGGSIIRRVSNDEEYDVPPLTMLKKSVEMGGILPDGYDHMTDKESRAFERTCELFEEFLKRKKRHGN
ncbi:MAG: hypothetical protein ACYC7L_06620 [Nitrospirota bacterium]